MEELLEAVAKVSKDVKAAARTLSDREARFLVDLYYSMQNQRIRSDAQARSLYEDQEPNLTFQHFGQSFEKLETQVKSVLDAYTQAHTMGGWMREIYGMGPVLSAGLLAYIDIEQCPTVGHIWAYAGLDPNRYWHGREKIKRFVSNQELGQKSQITEDQLMELMVRVAEYVGIKPQNFIDQVNKLEGGLTVANIEAIGARRPWNAILKTLCWKIGQSFLKQNPQKCPYRAIYDKRKLYEMEKNLGGAYADQAKSILEAKNIGKTTEAYKAYSIGQLPQAHINQRCERYAVKQFLADLHAVWYEKHFGKPAPLPYPIAILGHAHLRKVGEA